MAKQLKTYTTNQVLFDAIRDLKKASVKSGEAVFRAVAEKLEASASRRAEVNVAKLEKFAKDGEKLIIPGKILGDGVISKKVTAIAFSASASAIEKIEKAGGKFILLTEFLKKPTSDVRIIG